MFEKESGKMRPAQAPVDSDLLDIIVSHHKAPLENACEGGARSADLAFFRSDRACNEVHAKFPTASAHFMNALNMHVLTKRFQLLNPSIPKAQEPENFYRKDFAEQISVEREKIEKMMEKVSRKQDKL